MSILQRILDREALGSGGSQEVAVGANEGERRQGLRLHYRAGVQSGGELHRIIRAQPVPLSQFDGAIDNRTFNGKKHKVVVAVLQEPA